MVGSGSEEADGVNNEGESPAGGFALNAATAFEGKAGGRGFCSRGGLALAWLLINWF